MIRGMETIFHCKAVWILPGTIYQIGATKAVSKVCPYITSLGFLTLKGKVRSQ